MQYCGRTSTSTKIPVNRYYSTLANLDAQNTNQKYHTPPNKIYCAETNECEFTAKKGVRIQYATKEYYVSNVGHHSIIMYHRCCSNSMIFFCFY